MAWRSAFVGCSVWAVTVGLAGSLGGAEGAGVAEVVVLASVRGAGAAAVSVDSVGGGGGVVSVVSVVVGGGAGSAHYVVWVSVVVST